MGDSPSFVVVDTHCQALYHWLKVKRERNLPSATLVHIDAHADMDSSAPSVEKAIHDFSHEELSGIEDFKYSDRCLSVANHTSVAVHHGVVDSVFWFDPRKDYAVVYGDESGIKTKIENGYIKWGDGLKPVHRNESFEEALRGIATSNKPIILDIDLDAFLCVKDPDDLNNQETIQKHAERIRSIIKGIPKGSIQAITIAKSLTPSQWTPRDKVSEFLDVTRNILKEAGLLESDQNNVRDHSNLKFPEILLHLKTAKRGEHSQGT